MDENIGRSGENSFGNQAFSSNENKYYQNDQNPSKQDSDQQRINRDTGSQDYSQNDEDSWGNNQAKKLAEQTKAQKDARDAEQTALMQPDMQDDAKIAEQNPQENGLEQSLYRSNNKKDDKKQKQKRKFKKYSPLAAVLGILITIIVVLSSSTVLAPFGLVANGLEQFNTLRTSMNTRSSYIMPRMLHGGLNSKITSKGLFGLGSEKFKISDSMSKKLAKNGIKYIETTGTDGKPLNLLYYENGPDGKPMAVAAYDGDKTRIPDSIDLPSTEVDAQGNHTSTKVEIDSNNKMNFNDAMSKEKGFFKAEEKSTRTLKGHIAGWFDSIAEKVDTMLGNHGRNRQGSTQKGASDEEIQKNAEADGLKEEAENAKSEAQVEEEDPDNPDETKTTPVDDGPDEIKPGMDTESARKALSSRAKKAAAAVGKASAVTTAVGYACTLMKVINTISQTVGALQRAHILNYTTGFLEVVDKAKSGDSSTELHYYMNGLNQRGPTRDMKGDIIPGKESSSAWMSDAILQFFSNGELKVKSSDPAAKKYNSELAMQQAVFHSDEVDSSDLGGATMSLGSVLSKASGSLNTYKGCVAIQLTGDVLGVFSGVLEVVAAIASGGVSEIVRNIASGFISMAQAAAITAAVGGIISFIVPTISKTLSKNLIKNMVGEDAGYAINSGFNMYAGKQQQTSSGLPATQESLLAQYEENEKVIASESRYARETKSPLDITSPYTFLGSIMNTLIPVASTIGSPLQTVSKISSVVGSSVKSLMPTASADGMSKIKTSINKNCPSANAFNKPLAMDAFCNHYITSDYSTIRISPDEIIDKVGRDNLDIDNIKEDVNNGNPEIKDGSNLAKWTLSCAVRESHFGVADSNIAQALSGGGLSVGKGAIKNITGAVIGSLPLIGSIAQGVLDKSEAANVGWTTGENCLSEESKYFSRYSEDQRVFESAGLIDKSSVTAYLDRYYEKHPLDFTDSGIVARYTGMTKDQAEVALGLIEYNQYLAQYHPKEKGPKIKEKIEDYQYESNAIIAEIMPDSLLGLQEEKTIQRLTSITA